MSPNSKLQQLIDDVCRCLGQDGGKSLLSIRSQNNIRKALRCIHRKQPARRVALDAWEECLRIAPHVFALFSALLGADTIVRQGREAISQIIAVLKARRDRLKQHPTLCLLVQQFALASQSGLLSAVVDVEYQSSAATTKPRAFKVCGITHLVCHPLLTI